MAKREKKERKSKGRVVDFNEALKKKQRLKEERRLEEERKAKRLEEISNVRSQASVKRGRKKARRKAISILLIVLVVIGVTAYSLRNIAKLKIEEKKLKAQQEKLLKQKKKLKKELKKADDPDHIESEARRQLKMIKKGEILFLLPKGEKKKSD